MPGQAPYALGGGGEGGFILVFVTMS